MSEIGWAWKFGESCLFKAGPIVGRPHSAFLKIVVCDAWTAKVAGDLGTREGFRCGSFTSYFASQQLFLFLSCLGEAHMGVPRGVLPGGSRMADSLGWSEAKSFHAVSAVGRMGMVCGPSVFFRMAVLRLSWMMTPRWQALRVTPRLRVRSLRPKAENCQARVDLLRIKCPGGHQARAFVARGHELRCGMLWSPRFAVERLRLPAQRTTSSKVRVHQLLGTTTSTPARARLCGRACCPTHSAETGRTRSNSLMINRSGARFFFAA